MARMMTTMKMALMMVMMNNRLSQWEMSSLSGKIHANKAKSLRPLPSYISFPLEFEGVEE